MSKSVYQAGNFEFEILPESTSSMITTLGVTQEGLSSNPTFIEIKIDTVTFGNLGFGVTIGNKTNSYTTIVNMPSSSDNPSPYVIDSTNGENLKFNLSTDGTDVYVSVGTDSLDYQLVYQASTIASNNAALTNWLKVLPK